MRINRTRVVLVFVAFSLILGHIHASENDFFMPSGKKYLKNYNPRKLQKFPQNWAIGQDQQGIIYIGNNSGLMQFDGVSWKWFNIPNDSVRSLALNDSGSIFIGGKGEIGYFAPNEKGILNYTSLLGSLEAEHQRFDNVKRTFWMKPYAFFQTDKYLFRWNGKTVAVWEADKQFRYAFKCNGEIYIRQSDIGLMQLKDGKLTAVPGGEFFADKGVYMVVPFKENKILIGTRKYGFFLYDGIEAVKFPSDLDSFIATMKLQYGIRLSSGDYALGTKMGGLVVMGADGIKKCVINSSSNLKDNNVKYVYQDKWGNIWLGLEKGVSKIEYSSPFTFFDSSFGLPGLVLSIVNHRKDLYVGTSRGLYLRRDNGRFIRLNEVKGQCRALISFDDSIVAATEGGVYQIRQDKTNKLLGDYFYALSRSIQNKQRIWVGSRHGLFSLFYDKSSARLYKEFHFKEIKSKITCICEDLSGDLWIGTWIDGVYRLKFTVPGEIGSYRLDHYYKSHGLPVGEFFVSRAGGHVVFASSKKGVFRFDEQKNLFLPDPMLGPEFSDGSRGVFRIAEDNRGDIWFHSKFRNFRARPGADGKYSVGDKNLLRLTASLTYVVYPDPSEMVVWFGTNNGIIRYEPNKSPWEPSKLFTLIRKVSINGHTSEFCGIVNAGNGSESVGYPVFSTGDGNARFDYSAPFFQADEEISYRCLLKGNDKQWSLWSKDTKSVYTNLSSGTYSFHVKARNIYGEIAREASYKFKILPPWYKTWWAIAFFFLLGVAGLYLWLKWRVSKLEREKKHLESIVKESTKELKYKNLQLERQTRQLKKQAEQLKENDKLKTRFFSNISHEFRTPLTLIMSPIDKMIADCRDKKQKEQLKTMLRNTQQLLTLINQLLDLSKLHNGKLYLRASRGNIVPVLEGLLSAFQYKAFEDNVSLIFSSQEEEFSLYYDVEKIGTIVGNLLINALTFTPPEGSVTVSVGRVPKFLKISVKDTGVGIPSDQLPHIFERFYRVERPGQQDQLPGGTGIGLALTKELVELHHGRIAVQSDVGKGTNFDVFLPFGSRHLTADEIAKETDDQPDSEETKQLLSLVASKNKHTVSPGGINAHMVDDTMQDNDDGEHEGEHEGEGAKDKKDIVLVVEDNEEMRTFICDSLRPSYNVIEAVNGEDGLKKAKEFIPDLMVSDIMMPVMEGDELCRRLKRDRETCHIPIILLTAKASVDSVVVGLETGADDYITKPFSTKILIARIKNLIDIRRQLQLKVLAQGLKIPEGLDLASADTGFLLEYHKIIDTKMSDPDFNVESICKTLIMAKTSLYRKVKALTGETPNQYLQSCRLERADELLKAGAGNITDVAFAVGFSSSSYFSTCYKAKFGTSPSSAKQPQ